MKQENTLEAEKLTETTAFLPSDGASCSVYSDHRGNEFNFNDVVEGWSTGRIGRLVQVRKGCGQFGSDVCFLRTADGKLCTIENDALKYSEAATPKGDDTQETEYTIKGEWPETGFIVDTPAQPETPGSFSMMISSPNVQEHAPALAAPSVETGGDK